MATNAERAARGEPIMPDTTNPHNCQPHLEDAFSEVLAGMSDGDQAEIARSIIQGTWATDAIIMHLLNDVRRWMQDAAHEEGNY